MSPATDLLSAMGVALPIVQAPMAGTSSPAMAAAVSQAGALGSIAVGAVDADTAAAMISAVRARTAAPFNVNLFCHRAPEPDPVREERWIERLAPAFAAFGAAPPRVLSDPYTSFVNDDAMLAMLVRLRPRVVSFHFGLPDAGRIRSLHDAGIILLATATNLAEAQAVEAAGIDGIVAQGWEAGGHRGMFDPDSPDEKLGTVALTRLLVRKTNLPVIAAGGIMDGLGIRAMLDLGAVAAQLGTAFVACDESLADDGYRAALAGEAALHTVMTRVISGRPARCLANRFTAMDGTVSDAAVPAYPRAYDLGKGLNAAAKARKEYGFGAQWAGQAAPLARPMRAASLIALLAAELSVS